MRLGAAAVVARTRGVSRKPWPRVGPIVFSVVILFVGVASVSAPRIAISVTLFACALALLGLGDRLRPVFLTCLGLLLVGYAFFGKGFAYVSAPPLRVGDVVFLIAVPAVLATGRLYRWSGLHWLLIVFCAWGAVRTVPYLSNYRIDALRDGVLWGYAAFALAVAFTARKIDFERLTRWYETFIVVFLAWIPVAYALTTVYDALPKAPGSNVPFLVFKSGDMAVHLAGIAAFLLAGPQGRTLRAPFVRPLQWGLWFVGVGIVASSNRGGLLAIVAGLGLALLLRTRGRSLSLFIGFAVFATALIFVQPRFQTQGPRSLSLSQIESNSSSILSASPNKNLQGTKSYRVKWWKKIASYTFDGPYFWEGKGFGINLADADGFQLSPDHSLRAPHNSHMTVLARMGVPGLALWVVLQIAFAVTLARALRTARRIGELFWAQIDAWLLVYWLAMMVNTSFDPYLEGPQGGIWFWSVFGLGLAALRCQRGRETSNARNFAASRVKMIGGPEWRRHD